MAAWNEPRTGPELIAERKELLDLIAFAPIDHPQFRALLPIVKWIIEENKAAQVPPPRRGRPPKAKTSRNPWAEIDRLNLP